MMDLVSDRMIMWHEAGHAVAAMHYGRTVISCDVEPIPHCLVNSLFMSKNDKGVMLCAGAAMTQLVFGREIGGDVSDWAMAEKLGDLKHFKREAKYLCLQYMDEARYIVDSRVPFGTVIDLDQDGRIYDQVVRLATKDELPRWTDRLMMGYAQWQIKRHEGEMI